MSAAEGALPLGSDERDALLAGLGDFPHVVLAVSGGPDSTALLVLAAAWRAGRAAGPRLCVATVDHGLRPEAAREARAVAALCARLGLPHHTRHWQGAKPDRGVQAAARTARYGLLAELARAVGATALVTAHTLDDQAETVLFRLARGSGLSGLRAMAAVSQREGLALLRPFLTVPKARLVATVEAAGVPFVRDPANCDPRYTRARLRLLAPRLAEEGLDAARLGLFAQRVARLDAAAEAATDAAMAQTTVSSEGWRLDGALLRGLPEEIALRLMGRAIAAMGREGVAELAKLEALVVALREALAPMVGETLPGQRPHFRRTLAGALVAVRGGQVRVTPAPPRRVR